MITYIDTRYGTNKSRFTMGNMTNSSYVLSGLSRNDLRIKRTNLVNLKIVKWLLREVALSSKGFSLSFYDSLSFLLEFVFHFIIINLRSV